MVMQTILGLFATVSLILSSILMNAAFPLDKKIANWLAVALLAFAQIVAGATLLSEFHAISIGGLAAWHLFVLGLGFILWRLKGKPDLRRLYLPAHIDIRTSVAQNRFLTLMVSLLAIILILMILPTSFVDSDAAHYHVPRAHYWIQRASARHFYTDDIRQVERPPNASFLYMWQALISGSYGGLNFVQWLAAILTAIAIAALARRLGHRWPAAILASAIYLTLPTVVLQMSMPWSDVLSAMFVVYFVYFCFEGVLVAGRGEATVRYRYVAYAGAAFGLMIGTKLTSLAIIPSVVVALALFLIRRWHESKRVIVALALACLAGFIALGAYNYVLNILEFGRPIGIEGMPSSDLINSLRVLQAEYVEARESQSITADAVRYLYQTVDWTLLQPIPGADTAFVLNNRMYRILDDVLHLELESAPMFDLEEIGMRPIRSGDTGFGPLGFAVIIAAPVSAFLSLARSSGMKRFAMTASLVAIGVTGIVVVVLMRSWTPSEVRYFTPSVGLLIAALAPHTYSNRPGALIWLIPLGLIAIWITYQTAITAQRLDDQGRRLSAWQAEVLNNSLPADAHVATIGRVEFVHILEQFPGYHFEPVPRADLPYALQAGEFDAALVADPDSQLTGYRLPLEHDQSWLAVNARAIMFQNTEPFGIELKERNGDSALLLQGGRLVRRLGPDLVQLFLPVIGPLETQSSSIMEITFPVAPPNPEALSVECEGTQLMVRVVGSVLLADIPQSTIIPAKAFQLCRLRIADKQFGLQIPSPSIKVSVYSSP